MHAIQFNKKHPVGTAVRYWPGIKEGEGIETVTRSSAWVLLSGPSVVAVEGRSGGVALTHIEVMQEELPVADSV